MRTRADLTPDNQDVHPGILSLALKGRVPFPPTELSHARRG